MTTKPGCPILHDSLTVVKGGVFARQTREPLSNPESANVVSTTKPNTPSSREAKGWGIRAERANRLVISKNALLLD